MTTTTERPRTARTAPTRPATRRTPKRPTPAKKPVPRTSRLRSFQLRPSTGARWPFLAVVALLAGGGVIALLMLNTATAQASFTKSRLQGNLSDLTQKAQALQQKVSSEEAPEALAAKAAALGMAPGPQPGYYVLNADGSFTFVESTGGPTVPTPPAPEPAAAPTTPAADPNAATAPAADPNAAATPAADPNATPTPTGPTG